MDGELFVKIIEGEKGMTGIKTFLVFPVAAFYFAIMPWSIGTDKLVTDAQVGSGFLEKGLEVPFAVRKTVRKFKTIVGLDTLDPDAPAGIPLHQTFQEVSGGVRRLFRIRR